MTGPEGNSEFEGNIEFRGKQNSLFPKEPVIKWFVILQNKTKAKFENNQILDLHYLGVVIFIGEDMTAKTSGYDWLLSFFVSRT